MVGSRDLPPPTSPFFPRTFIRNQFIAKAPRLSGKVNLSSKVAIVTGANVGLGLESSRQLLSHGLSRLIMAVRSVDRSKAAASTLRESFPKATIELWPLDMSSYSSIQDFARLADTKLTRLDFAILNAGVFTMDHKTVVETGHEQDVQINYLSTVLLTALLLPVLKRKAPAQRRGQLTIVSAALTHVAKFTTRDQDPILPALDDSANFQMQEAYHVSKLLGHMFVYKLVDYVSADDVVVNLVCPGYVRGTSLARDAPAILRAFSYIFAALTARSLEAGATTYVDAAAVKGPESHGCFLMSWEVSPFPAMLYAPEMQDVIERLWRETMDELAFADVQGIMESMKRK